MDYRDDETAGQAVDIFPWNDNFDTGLADIDEQHRRLVQLLNRLASHAAFKTGVSGLNGILDELTDYTVYHFQAEEAIWQRYLPDDVATRQHKETHDAFVTAIKRFRLDQTSRSIDRIMEEALAFLTRWLASHILETDRRMAYTLQGVRAGMPREAAKRYAAEKMNGSAHVLIDIILSIYSTLSTNTLGLMRELSEHKRASSALEESEQRYHEVFRTTLDAISLTDAETGRYIEVNDAFLDITGYTREEVIGRSGAELALWAEPEERDRRVQLIQREGAVRNQEIRFRRKNGEEMWGLLSASRLELNGHPYYLSITRDITERKQYESKLRESEERHRLIVESAAEGFWMIDADRKTTYVNSTLCRILGYTPAEMIGRHPGEFADERNQAIFKTQMAKIEETSHRYYEIQLRHKDGHAVPLYFQATTHFGAPGKPDLAFAFVTDLTELRQTEERLARSELELKAIIDTEPECVKLLAPDYTLLQMNKAGLSMVDADSLDQVVGKQMVDLVVPKYRRAFKTLTKRVFEGKSGMLEFESIGLKGTHRWLETHAVPLRDTQGHITALLAVTRDVTGRKEAERALRIAAIAFESQEGMMVTDAEMNILQVNQAFVALTGYRPEEVIGRNPTLFKSGCHDAEFYRDMWQRIDETGTWQGEIWNRRKDGGIYPEWLVITAVRGFDGAVTNYVAAFTDLTQRKEAERKILHLAFYDALTSLPNRRLLNDRIDQARSSSQRSGHHGALIYLDLDRFKSLNDSHGHPTGDILLVEVSKRLIACVRDGDTVARLGGDEFVVMLEELSVSASEAANQAETVAENIRHRLNQPYQLGTLEHHSSPSIGVTLFKGKAETNDELLKRADLAMYQAKSSGRNTIRFFDPAMQEAVLARSTLESELRRALKRGDFVLHYQPQVDALGSVVSVEALARWQHPKRGLIPPLEFIPLAEETGLIVALGQQLMRQACMQIKTWSAHPETAALSISVNVSPRQFHDPDFTHKVLGVIEETGVNADRLVLEITESILLENTEDNVAKIHALRGHGIRFSIDDFGTGYSSLAYLNRLPLDELKIDRTFIKGLGEDDSATVICATFINLAHLLGLRVVAEGVETALQRHQLTDIHRCDVLQGFLISPPLPQAALEEFLRRGRVSP